MLKIKNWLNANQNIFNTNQESIFLILNHSPTWSLQNQISFRYQFILIIVYKLSNLLISQKMDELKLVLEYIVDEGYNIKHFSWDQQNYHLNIN